MNSYFTYYLAWIFISYALRTPWLLLGLGVLLVLRRFIPGPEALLRLFGRARRLRAQVELNRANITARRDLAVIYLDGMRPRSALPLLEEGLALSPNDAELLYLLGLALHRVGRHEEALAPLVRAVELDARVRYGLPYAVAGDALAALKRWDGAVDAYEHYLDGNSSDVSGYTRLARAHAGAGDPVAARETLREGLRTWGVLPASMKRRQFGRYLAAHWARATVLHEASAIALLVASLALAAVGARFAYAPVLAWFGESRRETAARAGAEAEQRALYEGFQRCGSQSTGDFAGQYVFVPDSESAAPATANMTPEIREAQHSFERILREQYANFEIKPDRIVSGEALVQEFCLTRLIARSPDSLDVEAVWHEDIADPGDASLVRLHLTRVGDLTSIRLKALNGSQGDAPVEIKLKRRQPPSGTH
ncbi:MAG TPA: tetratricopeptide repeat protein [Polyangiaceae bacterium]|nr:tetratricopeptide repeat protein [Polyangiaceae bacterium]